MYEMTQVTINRIGMLTSPASGRGKALQVAEEARQEFSRLGIEVCDLIGRSQADSIRLAEKAVNDDDIDALVICGGDGLLNNALQAQAGSGKPLGLIPAGSGNDTAREYHIPVHPRQAARVVADGFTIDTDLAIMRRENGEERYFGTIVCAGFDSLTTERANKMRWPSGPARYVIAIFAELHRFKPIPTRIVFDDKVVINRSLTMCSIGNTRTYGGGIAICPQANHHDGEFSITMLDAMPRLRILRKLAQLPTGNLENIPEVSMHHAKKVKIDMPGIYAFADGDKFFPMPVECEIVPAAGRYIVPRP